VVKICDSGRSKLKLLYPDDMPLYEKIRTIAREIYRAKDISADKAVKDQLAAFEALGYGKAPVCIAKTQYSFSTNPDSKGAPTDHTINVREVRLSAGAEFVVAICGEIMTIRDCRKYRRRMPSTSARMVRSWAVLREKIGWS